MSLRKSTKYDVKNCTSCTLLSLLPGLEQILLVK
jgi:hypothetical protein